MVFDRSCRGPTNRASDQEWTRVTTSSGISDQSSPDSIKLGEWLFRHRTALPLPIAAVILGLRVGQAPPSALLIAAGVAVTGARELMRLWGVRHIGAKIGRAHV